MIRYIAFIIIPFALFVPDFPLREHYHIREMSSPAQEDKPIKDIKKNQDTSLPHLSTSDTVKDIHKTGPKPKVNVSAKAVDNHSKKPKDSLIGAHIYYLEMRGMVRKTQLDLESTVKGTPLDSVLIEVFADTTRLIAVHYSDWRGETRFRLPLFRDMRVQISKKGYYSKILEINTKVPPDKKAAYIFPFDIDLFEDVTGFNANRFKKPIAKIKYDQGKGNFEYDEAFTSSVNRELKLLYKDYREKLMEESRGPKK
jgi:hypothetical protein